MTASSDAYLRNIARNLHMRGSEEYPILRELEGHIEDSAAELMDEGIATDDAFSFAVDELGDSESLAGKLYEVHTRGSWNKTALAVLPHAVLAMTFAIGIWTSIGWIALLLTTGVAVTVLGWTRGRPSWTFPWLGYSLMAPVASWGLALGVIVYSIWGLVTRGTLPVSIVIFLVSPVYFAVATWFLFRISTRMAQRDWVTVSLATLPTPLLLYWSYYFYNHSVVLTASGLRLQGINPSAAIIFLLLGAATTIFFRIARRVFRIILVAVLGPVFVVLAWLSFSGGPSPTAVFILASVSAAIMLSPMLLQQKSRTS